MQRKKVAPIDKNFLAMDTATTPQVIATLCLLSSRPDIAWLKERIAKLPKQFPKLRRREDKEHWVKDKAFETGNHLDIVECDQEDQIFEKASEALSRPMPADRPLWRFTLIQGRERSGLLFCWHHALSDGLGGLQVINAISGGDTRNSVLHPKRTEHHGWFQSMGKLILDLFCSPRPSPLNGKNSSERVISGLEFPLSQLKEIKERLDGTINDALLTIVTGAVRRYHLRFESPLRRLRAIMPVSTRTQKKEFSLGNYISAVGIPIPIELKSPFEQVRVMHAYISKIKKSGAIQAYALLGKINALLPKFPRRFICETQARRSNFICTNMPTTSFDRTIGGARVTACYGVPALLKHHGVGFGFVTYGQQIYVSLVSDPRIIKDPSLLLTDLQSSFEELLLESSTLQQSRAVLN